VIRGPKTERKIALCFTAHSYAEGAETILATLQRHKAKASFFLTGDFVVNPSFAELIQRMMREGHYIGPHSDKHLLYCGWEPDRRTLVSQAEFEADVRANIVKIADHARIAKKRGVPGANLRPIRYFMPPYEHYNEQISEWSRELGLVLVNFTPGTRSNADYTGEADKNFVSSQVIYDSILAREQRDADGLNGFLLLLHMGAGPGRSDKFHARFGELCDVLSVKGYHFVTVDELLDFRSRIAVRQ
jgi:peptidoglycan/xylan/chitin deacetylase (PgdA/CDA1 family)